PAQGVPIGDDLVTLSDIQNVTVEDEPDRSGNALVEEVPRKVRKFLACHARRAAAGTFKDLMKLPVNASPDGADHCAEQTAPDHESERSPHCRIQLRVN